MKQRRQKQQHARARASAHIYKGFDFLRKMKKIFEAKDEQANQKLDDILKIAQRAENLQHSLTSPYYNFADDIKFEDARLMAAKGDGQGLCYWFNCLGHKFGSWLHKMEEKMAGDSVASGSPANCWKVLSKEEQIRIYDALREK